MMSPVRTIETIYALACDLMEHSQCDTEVATVRAYNIIMRGIELEREAFDARIVKLLADRTGYDVTATTWDFLGRSKNAMPCDVPNFPTIHGASEKIRLSSQYGVSEGETHSAKLC
jgi:hypothetical protein